MIAKLFELLSGTLFFHLARILSLSLFFFLAHFLFFEEFMS